MNTIVIIDYGVGNLGSIENMIQKIGGSAKISSSHDDISTASKLILPGVGSFDHGMKMIKERGLFDIINEVVLSQKKLILGLCLGFQLMTKSSEEGIESGFGWFDAITKKFIFDRNREDKKIPHMGWNTLRIMKNDKLFCGLENSHRFYFVHSYYVVDNSQNTIAKTNYGLWFSSVMKKDNIIGAQFHPEKSHKFGMAFLKNFIAY